MEYNKGRVNEMVLALLYLTSPHDKYRTGEWKSMDWEDMDWPYKKNILAIPGEKSCQLP